VGLRPAATKEIMNIPTATFWNGWLRLAALGCLTASSGCTSVIGSAYLREAWLDAVEHAAESQADAKSKGRIATEDDRVPDEDQAEAEGVTSANSDTGEAVAAAAWTPATLDEAVDEADRRLAESGGLSEAARGTLIATLKSTPRLDWSVVVEEFTAALAAAHVGTDMATPAATSARGSQPQTSSENGASAAREQEVSLPAATVTAKPVAPMPPVEEPAEPAQAASVGADHVGADQSVASGNAVQPEFAIRNACFASRVRAWGVVDRFETSEFQPGQELIVYFELDKLASRESADGHTTRIETALKLVAADGRRVHEWAFEPLEETCGSHRHDYFARYLVALPASAPAGPCHLEMAVTDTVAGRTAHVSLPLDVAGR
jgi:hypothetical protein